MIGMKYVAKTTFEYAGATYHRGDEWEPKGGKFDKQIAAHMVIAIPIIEPQEPPKTNGIHAAKGEKGKGK